MSDVPTVAVGAAVRKALRMLVTNLHAAASVFITDDLHTARPLAAEKEAFRDIEAAATQVHFDRLRTGTAERAEASALHLDVLCDLKRVNAHLVAAAAYPVLKSQGGSLHQPAHDLRQAALVHQFGGFGHIKPHRLPLGFFRPVSELRIDPQQEHLDLAQQRFPGQLLGIVERADRGLARDAADKAGFLVGFPRRDLAWLQALDRPALGDDPAAGAPGGQQHDLPRAMPVQPAGQGGKLYRVSGFALGHNYGTCSIF